MKEDELLNVLELASWAPSIENLQCWNIEIHSETQLRIIINIESTILGTGGINGIFHSMGCFLETLRIAANAYQYEIEWIYQYDTFHYIDVKLTKNPLIIPDSLAEVIKQRSVNRLPYQKKAISSQIIGSLANNLPVDYSLTFIDKGPLANQFCKSSYQASVVRFKSDDFINDFGKTIETETLESRDKMPLATLGLNKLETSLFRWSMKHPNLMKWINRYLGGAHFTALRVDLIPLLKSGGYFMLHDSKIDSSLYNILKQGMIIQRFWLTLTQHHLVMQPSYILYLLAEYPHLNTNKKLAIFLKESIKAQNVFFCGRIGYPVESSTASRSIRKKVKDIILNTSVDL